MKSTPSCLLVVLVLGLACGPSGVRQRTGIIPEPDAGAEDAPARGGSGGGGTGGAAAPPRDAATEPAPPRPEAGPEAPAPAADAPRPPDALRPPDAAPDLAPDRAPDLPRDLPRDLPPDLRPDLPPDMPPAAAIPTAGLVGHWALDETSGSSASDSSPNGNHGQLMEYGAPDWRSGRRGNALAFDGVNNWVKVPRSASLEGITRAVTLAAWVRRSAMPAGWSMVMSRQAGTSGAEHYGLGFENNLPTALIASNQPGASKCTGQSTVAAGAWVHMAATWDGSFLRLYVGGTEACALSRPVTLSGDSTPLIIGGNANNANDDAQELFGGLLDDVLVYGRALSPAEIAALAR